MSVGFGFSVGDFIAAINLVSNIVDALRETGDSGSSYRSLITQLYSLESALLQVKRIHLDDAESQQGEIVALRQAAAQCQRTIDDFWNTIAKYQPALRIGGSGMRFKDGWMKVKWALCRKEDVARFQADLLAQTQSIEILLGVVQAARTESLDQRSTQNHKSLLGNVQDSYFSYMKRLTVVLDTVTSGVQQGRQLLEMMAQLIQTNIKVFQMVLNIQDVITRSPNQIDRLQPVFLIDALGRDCTFHLESIRSAAALRAVLKVNFEQVDSVASKIDDGAFKICDSATGREVDLSRPWEACFSPGQRAEMSIILFSYQASLRDCPKCHHECDGELEENVICTNCGLEFQCSVRKPQLQSGKPSVVDRYEELPFHDRLREFQKVVPERRFNNRQLDSLYRVVIHTLVPRFSDNKSKSKTKIKKFQVVEKVENKDTFRHHDEPVIVKGGEAFNDRQEVQPKIESSLNIKDEDPAIHNVSEPKDYPKPVISATKTILCLCQQQINTGKLESLVECTSCSTWQHSYCYYLNNTTIKTHTCFACDLPWDPHYDDDWYGC